MTLTIDAEKIDLPRQPGEALTSYLNRIADLLIKNKKSIGTCMIDGKAATLDAAGQRLFNEGKEMVVESVPLLVSIQANIALQCNALRRMEGECEALITDSLLIEPSRVAVSWNALCESVKKTVGFLNILQGLLTPEEIDMLINEKLAKLGSLMKEIAVVMGKGDVVSFSDSLETQLLPWLVGMRQFLELQTARVEGLLAETGETAQNPKA